MATDSQQASDSIETPARGYSDLPGKAATGSALAEQSESRRRGRRPHRRRTPTRLLSATGSLVVHACLIAALAAVVWRTTSLSGSPPREVTISFDIPTLGDAPVASAGRPEARSRPEPLPRETRLELEPPPDEPMTADAPPLTSLATAPEISTPPGPSPRATGEGGGPEFISGTVGAGAAPAASDHQLARGAGGVVFAGLGASNARSVVYVVDASGSMVTSLPFVIAELRRSISMLAPTQKFGVVLFRRMPDGRDGLEVFAPVLVRATASAQERLVEWLDSVHPSGRSVPLEGLERAIAYQPDAVFVLSRAIERSGGDGWETASGLGGARGLSGTMARVDTLNPMEDGRRAVVIQTIQFLDDDPTGIMQEIGRVHGSRTDASGKSIPGYRVIRRGEDLAQWGAER